MLRNYSLEYWRDGEWYVGRLKEVPGVFSQGASLEELERNIQEAFQLMMETTEPVDHAVTVKKKYLTYQKHYTTAVDT